MTVLLLPLCDQARPCMVLLLQVNLISCRFDFLLSCFYKSWTPVICSALVILEIVIMSSVDSGWRVFVRCWQISMEKPIRVLRWRVMHKFKSVGIVCCPSFFSLPTPSRLSRVGWFSHVLAFRSLSYSWGKTGTTRSLWMSKHARYLETERATYLNIYDINRKQRNHIWASHDRKSVRCKKYNLK